MRLEDLDYDLPAELIAQHPAARREDARLLVVDRAAGALHDSRIAELGAWLRPGDALALNETRVRPARLDVRRASGGRIELLVLRPEPDPDPDPDPDLDPPPTAGAPTAGAPTAGAPTAGAPAVAGARRWRVLAKPAKKAAPGTVLTTDDGCLALEVVESGEEGERVVRVVNGDLDRALEAHGRVPLPPYIHRPPEPEDRERYQTVFARVDGAVAAPTAGLHFTDGLLASLAERGVARVPLLLHVGPGTFRPISADDPAKHVMDEEWYEITPEAAAALNDARARGGRVVAVGTTAVRALESACDANGGALAAARGWTRKFILPPYEFRAVDALLTNFHLPRTTLLLLVAALAGEELLKRAYAHAVAGRYRFYSYGDAMLVV